MFNTAFTASALRGCEKSLLSLISQTLISLKSPQTDTLTTTVTATATIMGSNVLLDQVIESISLALCSSSSRHGSSQVVEILEVFKSHSTMNRIVKSLLLQNSESVIACVKTVEFITNSLKHADITKLQPQEVASITHLIDKIKESHANNATHYIHGLVESFKFYTIEKSQSTVEEGMATTQQREGGNHPVIHD